MSLTPSEASAAGRDASALRLARRQRNERVVESNPSTDAQGLVELSCECSSSACERTVRVPVYVYRRMLEAGDQSILQAGHHAYEHYRTIISVGLLRIEERA